VTAWDLELDGRRRFDLRLTLILHPALGLIVWLPYAPPLQDAFRRTYQQLLQWNDELPFLKFALDPDGRIVLSVEIPMDALSAAALDLAVARVLAVADHLVDASAAWLWPDGKVPSPLPDRRSRGEALLERHAGELAELIGAPATLGAVEGAGGSPESDEREAARP
jgi:hypothetical protein